MKSLIRCIKRKYISLHDKLFPGEINIFYKISFRKRIAQEKRVKAFQHDHLKNAISLQFEEYMGCSVNLDHPKTFQDKMAWLKLYYQLPSLAICADKFTATKYVQDKVHCQDSVFVKQLGAYTSVDHIDFKTLPNAFVLKSNWGSGSQIIVKDKKTADLNELKEIMKPWLHSFMNHYYDSYEYSYKHIEPKIICEELLDFEYKLEFHCFNGEPKFVWTVFDDKTSQVAADFRDLQWERMPVKHKYPNTDYAIEKPADFEDMLSMAQTLCKDFPFVRVDFYKCKEGFKFSELTFYPWAGLQPFTPREYDTIVGEMLTLPTEKVIEK